MTGLRLLSMALAATVLLVTGCRSASEEELSLRSIAEDMIVTEVAAQAGLGELTAICPDVAEVAVGTTFDCTATSDASPVLGVTGIIDGEGRVMLATTNMITAAALPSFERRAAEALNAQVGSQLVEDSIDCGEQPVVFGQDRVMVCALEDPLTKDIFDISMTITDIENREFSLVVAESPRS